MLFLLNLAGRLVGFIWTDTGECSGGTGYELFFSFSFFFLGVAKWVVKFNFNKVYLKLLIFRRRKMQVLESWEVIVPKLLLLVPLWSTYIS